ncbi:Ca2+-binding EF-Hand superfamily protein [Thecamonas trahens ATCC 50062]|uniref:Ca2+-binding EF-Hand superfamily protein n=1 Tax=Thecamonas trahens ATCC 50062 TaxID=461836 RepID=A0A0L0D3F9_THETB|nr:Ca2+-binding EF-Hand superfamily protein [Thecamonas trahens ATCC 50062]KNC46701.1 Ca2+-binding EF-Hand superfamily protein [Thecamonas trahens ATCC 50062]|eukprot:XP_013760467.1 Ca2+-binding EF-Hand superfamily protein [Thecamonas trahens ATCC 50062]
MRALGFDVRKEEVLRILQDLDKDEAGTIDFSEFKGVMAVKISERDPLDEIRKAFRLFDEDQTGFISLKNMRRIAKELGEHMTDEELQAMIDEFDRDQDGMISESEFCAIMLPDDDLNL